MNPFDKTIIRRTLMLLMGGFVMYVAVVGLLSSPMNTSGIPEARSGIPTVAPEKPVQPLNAMADPMLLAQAEISDRSKTSHPIPPIVNATSWSNLRTRAQNNEFSTARLNPISHIIIATTKDERMAYYATLPPSDTDTLKVLAESGVDIEIMQAEAPRGSLFQSPLFLTLLSTLLIVGVLFYINRRQMGLGGGGGMGGSGGPMGLTKNRARMIDPQTNAIRFKDVAGCDEAKVEVAEIVEFLRRPDDYARVGARAPHGILMSGPPGTGKTLLAKAIAGEAGVPFFSASGSDFVEMFVGVGAARIRDMFLQAKQHSPSIVFIDEIDAIGQKRGGGMSGAGHDEREQTLNALLVEMDGFIGNPGVVVIAATNRPDVLDDALRRPGRFDREVVVSLPDRAGRASILAVHAARVPVSPEVDWDIIARGTPGFSGADLANVVNEAAIGAARVKSKVITRAFLEEARDKVMMGVERKGGLKNPQERKIVAYHEAGHALVAHFDDNADPVHKVTIMPRGQSLGLTMQLPVEDLLNHDRNRLMSTIKVLMGGRAAEDVALQTATVGASNDFERASALARNMVAKWGMSDLGLTVVSTENGWQGTQWSEVWREKVDNAVSQMVASCYRQACELLRDRKEVLDAVAQALLERETLDAEAFMAIVTTHVPKHITGSSLEGMIPA